MTEWPRVRWFDGVNANERAPLFVLDEGGFSLIEGERREGPLPLADLQPREPIGGGAVFGLKKRPGWRIVFAEGMPEAVRAALPGARRYGGVVDRIGLWPSVLGFAAVAAGAVFIVAQMPSVVARVVPPSYERRLGDLMVGDFGGRMCNGPGGQAALDALRDRLQAPAYIDVHVVNIPVINAVTLPGGKILIFDKLVKEAKSPDEVAGVLAHELGHAQHRDVLAGLLRQFGLSMLLGGLEGHVSNYTNAILSTTYTRSAEASADGYAIDDLKDAHISPAGTAQFFVRLAHGEPNFGKAGKMLSYLATHPMSADRARRFSGSAKATAAYTPALDAAQWQALRTICSADPKAKGLEFDF